MLNKYARRTLAALVCLTGLSLATQPLAAEPVSAPAIQEGAVVQQKTTTPETLVVEPKIAAPCAEAVCGPNLCCPGPGGDPDSRWYLSLGGGWQDRETVHEQNTPTTFLVFNSGFALNAAIGHRFGDIRVEGETSLFNNMVETAGAAGFVTGAVGNVNVRSYSVNLYYDLPLTNSPFNPYVGGGIGTAQSSLNSLFPDFFRTVPAAFGGPFPPINSTSDFAFAYQFRAGVGYDLTDKTEVFLGYRYHRVDTLTFAANPFGTFHPLGAKNHSIETGLRVKF